MLKDMGTRFDRHLIDMEEKDVKFRMRLDELQEQLVELKERSPGTSPKSSHPTSPQGSASPNIRPPSYLIIMGGWKEGERKDYLDVQLPKLFAAAGVSQHVKEVQLFGKRPRCAKISLKFENDEQNGKRDLQQSVISKLRGQQWTPQSCDKPVWVTQDRTPAQRATNKAVAIIGGFLQSAMKVTRESFEIDHWQAARTYVGDHRISGPDQFVVWPVQDHASGVSVWCDLQGVAKFVRMDPMEVKKMWDHYVVPRWHGLHATSVSTLGTGNHSFNSYIVQLGTWNVQGKALDEVMSFLDAYRLDFMVAGFQEVTATTLVGRRPEFIDFHDSGMRALLAKPTGCFRACGILLDLDYVSELGRVAVGHSHIRACVKLVGWTQPVCIVCAHLPHSGRPLHDLEDALQSMQEDLQYAVDRLMPLVLMGDLNVSLVDSVTDRSHLVRSTLDGLGLHHFSHCADPTRHPSPRRLDHIVYSASFLSSCEQVSADAHLPWVAECYRWDAKDGLGVDHVLVSHDLLVQVRVPVSGRRHVQFRPVGKYQVLGRDPLIRGIQDFHRHCRQDGFDSFQSLVHLASQSTRKTVRESYKDNALIKDLCRVRSVTADPAERCELSRNIFALRKGDRTCGAGLRVAIGKPARPCKEPVRSKVACNTSSVPLGLYNVLLILSKPFLLPVFLVRPRFLWMLYLGIPWWIP